MRPRWRKVFSDLIDNKARTLLVVFSIAVGVFAIGVLVGAYEIISTDMSISYAANNPSNIEVRMSDFDEEFLHTLGNVDGVEDVEGRWVFGIRVRPMGSDEWTSLNVITIDDFEENKINLLSPVSGPVAPEKNQILLQKEIYEDFDVEPGDTIEFQLSDQTVKSIVVAGIVADSSTDAIDFLAPPLGYITPKTLRLFNEPEGNFNRLYATVEEGKDDDDHIKDVLSNIKDKVEKNDYLVFRAFNSKTHEHPLESTINAVLGILFALGILILFLSSSLIANTLSALLNQHLRHIGVMKLIGGRDKLIFRMYIVLLFAFGVLSLVIAVPAGGWGAYALSEFMGTKIGFELLGPRIVPLAFIVQILIGILVPLVAGLVPVIKGSRVTVQKALSGDLAREAGDPIDGEKKESRVESFQIKAASVLADRGIRISRPLLVSLRNTFRQRSRLMLTLFTLLMGGATFISVFNVRVSLTEYIQVVGNYFLADVTISFEKLYRINEVRQFAMDDPRVTAVEGWAFASAEILYNDDTVADNVDILAPPAESPLVNPLLVDGRWIGPTDKRKLAISESVYDSYPDLQAGDEIPLKINGREEVWEVVGIFKFIGMEGSIAYAPYEYIAKETNVVNQSASFRIVSESHELEVQEELAKDLDAFFRGNGFQVSETSPGLAMLNEASESIDILITFLLIMAVLTAVVGAMGLAGTMSMNVLERTREIGIMRAVGATDLEIIRMVLVEGLLIGIISFVLSIVIAFPFTYILSGIVSRATFETPIAVVFTPTGYGIWLGLVIILSVLASVIPARSAARLTIREVLAYE